MSKSNKKKEAEDDSKLLSIEENLDEVYKTNFFFVVYLTSQKKYFLFLFLRIKNLN